MRKILSFLYRGRTFLLFALLEVIAFVWISNSRSYQRSVLLNSSNQVSGYLFETTNSFQNYFELNEQNEILARENALFHTKSSTSIFPLEIAVDTIEDSLNKVRYAFVEGQVINSSYRKARNYMTINRGSIHGIESNMGIIGPFGVVGIIKDVGEHFCTAIPLINPSFRVSGRIKSNSFFGPVEWRGNDHQYAYLIDIPRYAEIVIGDTVVSDSRSQIFPPDIAIGVIESYTMQEDQNFFAVKIKLSTDFAALDYVYVIQDKMKNELQELESLLEE